MKMLPFAGILIRQLNKLWSYKHGIIVTILMCSLILHSVNAGEVLWAVNCGGEEHTDVHGIHYQADPLDVGYSSDFGKSLMIQRVVPQDQILYQTERYHVSTFGYDLPVYRDGEYVLVLKFSEVWFAAPNQKVRPVLELAVDGRRATTYEYKIIHAKMKPTFYAIYRHDT